MGTIPDTGLPQEIAEEVAGKFRARRGIETAVSHRPDGAWEIHISGSDWRRTVLINTVPTDSVGWDSAKATITAKPLHPREKGFPVSIEISTLMVRRVESMIEFLRKGTLPK